MSDLIIAIAMTAAILGLSVLALHEVPDLMPKGWPQLTLEEVIVPTGAAKVEWGDTTWTDAPTATEITGTVAFPAYPEEEEDRSE